MFSSLNYGRALVHRSYESKSRTFCYCLAGNQTFRVRVYELLFIYSNSSSENDRYGILSTMQLDIGCKEWSESCSRWLSCLEVSKENKEEDESGEFVTVHVYLTIINCTYQS